MCYSAWGDKRNNSGNYWHLIEASWQIEAYVYRVDMDKTKCLIGIIEILHILIRGKNNKNRCRNNFHFLLI